MECLACSHTVMGHRDAHEAMMMIPETTTLEDINALARCGVGSEEGDSGEEIGDGERDSGGKGRGREDRDGDRDGRKSEREGGPAL